jgi:hypothetical protein
MQFIIILIILTGVNCYNRSLYRPVVTYFTTVTKYYPIRSESKKIEKIEELPTYEIPSWVYKEVFKENRRSKKYLRR